MYLLGVPSFEVHSNFSKDFLCSTFDEKNILPVEECYLLSNVVSVYIHTKNIQNTLIEQNIWIKT